MTVRRHLRWVALVTLLLSVALATPAWSAGPWSGSYQGVQRFPSGFQETLYLVVLQNDSHIGLVLLASVDAFWTWGEGFVEGDGVVRGTLFMANGQVYGHFSATFAPDGRVVAVLDDGDVVSQLEGTRIF